MKAAKGPRLRRCRADNRGCMAAPELPLLLVRNCAAYVTARRIIDSGQVIGDDCRAYVMPRKRSVPIDKGIDLALAGSLVEFLGGLQRVAS